MDRRHRKMIEDVVNETMTAIGDSAARCVMNSIPVPWEDYEEKLVDNMVEVMSDIMADELARKFKPSLWGRVKDFFDINYHGEIGGRQ